MNDSGTTARVPARVVIAAYRAVMDEANQIWGVPVLSTMACTAGKGLLIDSSKFGYVAIREAPSVRIGYSGCGVSILEPRRARP